MISFILTLYNIVRDGDELVLIKGVFAPDLGNDIGWFILPLYDIGRDGDQLVLINDAFVPDLGNDIGWFYFTFV